MYWSLSPAWGRRIVTRPTFRKEACWRKVSCTLAPPHVGRSRGIVSDRALRTSSGTLFPVPVAALTMATLEHLLHGILAGLTRLLLGQCFLEMQSQYFLRCIVLPTTNCLRVASPLGPYSLEMQSQYVPRCTVLPMMSTPGPAFLQLPSWLLMRRIC
jgi:hypothetical protein